MNLISYKFNVFFEGNTSTMDKGFDGTTSTPSGIALAFYDALWAYDGWYVNLFIITNLILDKIIMMPINYICNCTLNI